MDKSLFLALGSVVSFSVAVLIFARFAHEVSNLWINAFKASFALLCYGIVILINGELFSLPHWQSIAWLLLSGFLGLTLGDWMLLSSFRTIGPSRGLMIFGFKPIFLILPGYFTLGQDLTGTQLVAISMMIGAVVFMSMEHSKNRTHIPRKAFFTGIMIALIGGALDSAGILFTRYAFEISTQMDALEANFYRCGGAVLGFGVIQFFRPIHFFSRFKKLSLKDKRRVSEASFLGTFFALALWLAAVRTGHLATVSAIGGLDPMVTTVLESIRDRKLPSLATILALALSTAAFLLLTHAN